MDQHGTTVCNRAEQNRMMTKKNRTECTAREQKIMGDPFFSQTDQISREMTGVFGFMDHFMCKSMDSNRPQVRLTRVEIGRAPSSSGPCRRSWLASAMSCLGVGTVVGRCFWGCGEGLSCWGNGGWYGWYGW